MTDFTVLPTGLPEPEDDGAAEHLTGRSMPSASLAATDGRIIDLAGLPGITVVYVYPMTGVPGVEQPEGWDLIPPRTGTGRIARPADVPGRSDAAVPTTDAHPARRCH